MSTISKIVLAISLELVMVGFRRFSVVQRIIEYVLNRPQVLFAVIYIPTVVAVFAALWLFPTPISKESALLDSGKKVIKLVDAATHSGGGTGFSVRAPSGKSYTLTNEHICEMAKDGVVDAVGSVSDDRYTKLHVIEESHAHDLCLLDNMPNYRGFKVGDSVSRGDEVTIVGHPLLEPTTVSVGQVNSFQNITVLLGQNMDEQECERRGGVTQQENGFIFSFLGIQNVCIRTHYAGRTDAIVYPGNSGSPVLDTVGDVVGVLFAASNETHWGYIVPLEYVKSFLSIY